MSAKSGSSQYSAAIIGHTGEGDYGHGLDTVYGDMPEVEVMAVADADEEGLAAAGERTGARRLYADYRVMLGKEKVDLVNIGPRAVGERVDMVTACAEAGVRAVFCEKPMAATLREADTMLEACERHGMKMAVAHRRANPYEQHAKELVDLGEIGELQVIRAHGKWDRRSGAEDLAVLGTHMMDSMRYLAGADVEWVHGHITQDGREVTAADAREGAEGIGRIAGNRVAAYYVFANGVTGHFESNPGDTQRRLNSRWLGFEAHGTQGIITVRNSPEGEMYLYRCGLWVPDGAVQWERVLLEQWEQIPQGERTHRSNQIIVRELIEAMEAGTQVVEASSGYDARAALEMIMAVHESQRLQGRVSLPLTNRDNPYAAA
jgi:predicted dehydrogenase